MESKWSANVFKEGLGQTGATIASRTLTTTPIFVLTNSHFASAYFRAWEVPSDMTLPYVEWAFFIPPGHPHFPFGYAVEPDGPV